VEAPLPGSRYRHRRLAGYEQEVNAEAKRRKVELLILTASEAIGILIRAETAKINVNLHVTC